MKTTKICQFCGKEFIRRRGSSSESSSYFKTKKFCSQKCFVSYKRKSNGTDGKEYLQVNQNGRLRLGKILACPSCGSERFIRFSTIIKPSFTGYCEHCLQKYLPTPKGDKNPAWRGGRYTCKGYVMKWLPKDDPFICMANKSDYVPEHRYVVACHIGRPLEKIEQVHHINGIKDDNRIENLELLDAHVHTLVTKLTMRIKELELKVQKLKGEAWQH